MINYDKDSLQKPSNYLFTSDGSPGLDLRALDLQTERDFGIGTYCDALYYFNLTEGECIKKFSDFEPYISDEVSNELMTNELVSLKSQTFFRTSRSLNTLTMNHATLILVLELPCIRHKTETCSVTFTIE